ncbi:unnamed protein product [Phytophthora fragariaefolia]|uniref:Unnamed protein product n=1 Tax=Phytophthora fragariaefolia TaxID=1490495 RepID=A0A9W6YDT4_9STRA|nr:unnamed protein product [Phytophthora fragariaefolia]
MLKLLSTDLHDYDSLRRRVSIAFKSDCGLYDSKTHGGCCGANLRAAIGMLMFQIALMPWSPKSEVDIRYVEGAIEEQLSHVSVPCRELLLDCLSMSMEAMALFSAIVYTDAYVKCEFACSDEAQRARAFDAQMVAPSRLSSQYKQVRWIIDIFGGAICVVQFVAVEVGSTLHDGLAKASTRRVYTRSRLYVSSGVLRRGPLPVPVPAGHSLLPQIDGEDREQRRQFYTFPAEYNLQEDLDSKSWRTYDDFDYEFPSFYTSPKSVLYDNFEVDGEWLQDKYSEGEFMPLPKDKARTSVSSADGADDARRLQREVVRSLQHGPTTDTENDTNASAEHTIYENVFKQRSRSMAANDRSNQEEFGYEKYASHDAVHFSAFGPAQVALCDFFRIDIWAYLKQQREIMLEAALEHNELECGQRVQPLRIQRGTLVTVSIEPNTRFGIKGENCKSFRWHGDVIGVSFDLFRTSTQSEVKDEEGDDLCIAKFIAGTKVSLLYIRLQAVSTQIYSTAAAGITKSSDLTLLDAHMEHVTPNVLDIPGDDLELIRPIGRGAFGDAVLARWKSTSQDVVVKMISQDLYRSSDAVAEFRHEATVMNLLGKHPHVVELLGVSSSGSSIDDGESRGISLVTEYLPNGSVEDVLGINAGAEPSSVSIFSRTVMARDAAHGLANIHQGNFLHRDIAARNCLVDAEFRVKVCDFGLSRRLRSSGHGSMDGFLFDDDRHGFGPLKWMAPESITPPHLFSTYSDSYMFGVLLYEIFSGQPPFPNLSSRDAAALILEGHHVPIPTSMPHAHWQLMEQCFEVHPLRRPSMDQIYHTLDQWVLHDTKAHVASTIVGRDPWADPGRMSVASLSSAFSLSSQADTNQQRITMKTSWTVLVPLVVVTTAMTEPVASSCMSDCQSQLVHLREEACQKWREKLPRPDLFNHCGQGFNKGKSEGCEGYCNEYPDVGYMKAKRLDACNSLKGAPPMERQQACQAGFSAALELAKDAAVPDKAEAAKASSNQGSQTTDTAAGPEKKVKVKKVIEPESRRV